ncbi:MAG: PIN domain-containing protein [Treponema sp.]|nr:PIN domain-containing protein [Treponema sp.]
MNFLVDSSAWIEYFRGNQTYSFLDDFIVANSICTNDIVLSELLPAIIHKNEYKLAELLNNVKKFALVIDWQDLRNIQLLNLRHGNNNIGISDIVIAQHCIQNGLRIVANDKHFRAMAEYIPLKVYE